ncbi:MAG: Slp family lipoprotein [Syntrophaceae bacterium]|nr:Slp family lipoprotein [Syntrophaceae bacterium]
MKTWPLWFLFFFLAISLSGCAHVISKDIRTKSEPSLTLNQVRQSPETFKGKWVIWGGEIVQSVNQKDGSTQIEVFQMPLGWRGEPKETVASEGRFLVSVDQYLDSYIYRKGKKITIAGEIQGEMVKPLGEMDYRYPLISSKQIYLWPDYYYYPYPDYYYDPWWGPPYWWGFGFGIIYHHHHRR